MKNFQKTFLILILISLLALWGCHVDHPTEAPPDVIDSGTADFSRFAVIGASYEAGIQDYYLAGHNELNCYPAMIAEQMGQAE